MCTGISGRDDPRISGRSPAGPANGRQRSTEFAKTSAAGSFPGVSGELHFLQPFSADHTYFAGQTGTMLADRSSDDFSLLIADDNSTFRRTLREVLERRFRFDIVEVDSGEEALDCVQECRIDIVLLDMHMHRMSGLETIRQLKDLDVVRPCILITSDRSEQIRRHADQVEADAVLHKPLQQQQLVTTVSRALHDAYDAPLTGDFPV